MFSVFGVVLALLCGGQIAWHGYSAHIAPTANVEMRQMAPRSALAVIAQRKFENFQTSLKIVSHRRLKGSILEAARVNSTFEAIESCEFVSLESLRPRDGPVS